MSVAERVADIAASLSWPWSSMHEGHKMSEEDARLAVANYATFKPVVRMRLLMALWHLPARDKAAIAADLERRGSPLTMSRGTVPRAPVKGAMPHHDPTQAKPSKASRLTPPQALSDGASGR